MNSQSVKAFCLDQVICTLSTKIFPNSVNMHPRHIYLTVVFCLHISSWKNWKDFVDIYNTSHIASVVASVPINPIDLGVFWSMPKHTIIVLGVNKFSVIAIMKFCKGLSWLFTIINNRKIKLFYMIISCPSITGSYFFMVFFCS